MGLLGCELTLANELAAYVAKLDGNGRCTWSRVLQEEDDVTFTDLAVDPTGAVVVAGSFDTRLKIGSRTLTGSMRKHVFVAKFRADGTLAWADAATGGNSGITGIYGQALALGPEGQVVFTGSITGTADFGSVRLKTRDAVFPGEGSIPMHGVFLVGYGAEGGMLSARIVAHGAQVEALSVGSDGAVVMSGMFKGISGLEREAGRAYFGTQASLETTHRTQGGQTEDTWVGRFSSVTGGLDWVLQGKSTGDARSTHLVVLGDGRIAVLGMARRGMTWVGSEHRMPEHPTAPTEPDVFLSLLSSSGKVLRTWTIGGTGSDYPNGLAAGGGQVWATGSFKDRVQFGSARLESRAAGKSNGFLWRVPVGE